MDPNIEKGKKKPRGGKRCSVGDCTHSTSDSVYTVYSVIKSGKSAESEKRWRDFVASSRGPGNFDKRGAVNCYACDGHFTEDSFVERQVFNFNMGTRKNAPELKLDAVPSIIKATKPHFPKLKRDAYTTPPFQQTREEMEVAAAEKALNPISMTAVAFGAKSPEVLTTRKTAQRLIRVRY